MAIKAKSRRRKGRRGPAKGQRVAPAPKPGTKRIPLMQRSWVRRTLVAIVALTVLAIGLRSWQNAARAHSLRLYLDRLATAQAPAVAHLTPASQTYLETTARNFIEGKTGSGPFLKIAEVWEEQFRAARDNVKALLPPPQLRHAQRLLVAGLDQYVGVARLYNLAAQQRTVAARQAKPAADAFEDKVQVTLLHAGEWVERANDVYSEGGLILEQYKRAWLGIPLSRDVPGVPRGLLPSAPA